MSLVALAIRTCTFLSLYRKTMAGDRVYESAITPIDEQVKDIPEPFITVAVDETSGSTDFAKSFLDATDSLVLVVDFAIGQRVTVDGMDGATASVVQIPFTDPGLEWSLDIMATQIRSRLAIDPVWSDLWKRFVLKTNRVMGLRAANAEGTRFASRQMLIDVQPIADPVFGAAPEPGSVMADFLAALRAIPSDPVFGADPELTVYGGLADAIEAAMLSPDSLEPWQIIAGQLGIASQTAVAIGVGPMAPETIQRPIITAFDMLGDRLTSARIDEMTPPDDAE